MGIYGYSKNTTPFLDSLAGKSILFENAIAPSYLTFSTDGAILSSLYPSQNGIISWTTSIKDSLYLLPQLLGMYDYNTSAFVSPSLWSYFGFAKKFDFYYLNNNLKNIKESKKQVEKWVTNFKEPFFLFWHIYDAHLPFIEATNEFYTGKFNGKFQDKDRLFVWEDQKIESGKLYIAKYKDNQRNRDLKKYIELSAEDIAYIQASYNSGIRSVDDELKTLFSAIEKNPFFSNTLFIITSEHGEDLIEHGFIFHKDLYDVNIRVPLLFYHPKLSAMRVKNLVSLLDITPTLLNLVDIPQLVNSEGIDILSSDFLKTTNEDRMVFSERTPFDEYAVRTLKWKYILRNSQKKKLLLSDSAVFDNFMKDIVKNETTFTDELYDLETDPGEKNNLIGKKLPIENVLREKVNEFKLKMNNAQEININQDLIHPKYIDYP